MQKNILKSGTEIPEPGLECMSLGTEYHRVEEIVECAIENGITYFDTADIYDRGVNENIVGKSLKKYQNRDDIVIGTKVGNRPLNDGSTTWDPSKKYIRKNVKNSLKRLGLEQLDLYQLHGGTVDDPLDEMISAFNELKKEGVIKAYGISSIRPNVTGYYLKHSQIETIMSQFNLIDNRPERLLNHIHSHGVEVLVRGPVFKGLLASNSVSVLDQKLSDGTFDYNCHELGETIVSVKEVESSLSALSFEYLKSHDTLGSIIIGASSVSQLGDDITNFNKTVSLDQIKSARRRVKDLEHTQHLE